ncbi:hypothetical protein JW977_03155 [Candidatus Falkowbacteria bacterium]|nr:hypothetical protein [Candidatus Falkowbacteria bacterium]
MKQLIFAWRMTILIIIVVFLPLGLIFGVRFFLWGDPQGKVDLTPFRIIILENQIEFSNIARELHSNGIYEFCEYNPGDFKINGYYLDFNNKIFTSEAPLGIHRFTQSQVLEILKITTDQIDEYGVFLNKYTFLKCIEEDLNLKTGKEYAFLFEVNDYKGFAYLSDGSINQNFRQDIFEEKYKEINRLDDTNWYEFVYKNKYGI